MYSDQDLLAEGLPHSDILGSKPARGSPRLFAACHVLRRLLVPRHPPNALSSFNLLVHLEHRTLCDARRWTHTHHRKLERDLQLTHHAQEPFISVSHRNPHPPSPLGTATSKGSTQQSKILKTSIIRTRQNSMQHHADPCGPIQTSLTRDHRDAHHNRDHCTITHLNTRNSRRLCFRFLHPPQVRQPIAKNPGQLTRCHHPAHQHARPNAPKPIHPDKEQFCSRQQSWEQTSKSFRRLTFAGTTA